MANVDLVMPKMGESIMEATILKWLKQPGDSVEIDEPIVEIATDKVDSDIPAPVSGTITEIFYQENDVVPIGKVIAKINTESDVEIKPSPAVPTPEKTEKPNVPQPIKQENGHSENKSETIKPIEQKEAVVVAQKDVFRPSTTARFYSPLVRTIAQREAIPIDELDSIQGTGANGRVTKKDILSYIDQRSTVAAPTVQQEVLQKEVTETKVNPVATPVPVKEVQQETFTPPSVSISGNTEIIEMDRMRKLIAEHMIKSKQTSAHVTSFVEVDVTNIVKWRERIKSSFQKTYGEKITYTPIFMEAVNKAIKDFPMINCSLQGDKIIKKNYVNLGMATALESGNLIVPVIKNADHLNLLGLTKAVNDLANRARKNNLKPEEIQDGTFTVTNVGTFGNVMGTPIINQPQVAIMAVGAIRKKPAVVETEHGDLIAVRHMMFLSLSYDHRIVDGYLGGSFLSRVAKYLESFDPDRSI